MASRQLSNKDSDGTVLGQSATDKIAFFGKTARAQITFITSVSAAQTTSVVKTRINLILAALKNLGLMASS